VWSFIKLYILVVLRCSKIDNYRLPLRGEFKVLCVSVYVKIKTCILMQAGSPSIKYIVFIGSHLV
jgi:hypothetical protein